MDVFWVRFIILVVVMFISYFVGVNRANNKWLKMFLQELPKEDLDTAEDVNYQAKVNIFCYKTSKSKAIEITMVDGSLEKTE